MIEGQALIPACRLMAVTTVLSECAAVPVILLVTTEAVVRCITPERLLFVATAAGHGAVRILQREIGVLVIKAFR